MSEKICSICNTAKPVEMFFKAKRMKDGLQSACKDCASKQSKSSRKKKQSHYAAVGKARQAKYVEQMRDWKSSKGCKFCKENFGPCLELHHDGDDKECNPADAAARSFNAFLKEAEKCVVVCANCHRKVHHGILTI